MAGGFVGMKSFPKAPFEEELISGRINRHYIKDERKKITENKNIQLITQK